MPKTEELLDTLFDLKHDLGKHLQLPLSLLPKDASAEHVQSAARDALLRTRRGPHGEQSARALWECFLGETRDLLSESSALVALQRAMRAALAWEDKLIGMGSDADATRIRKDLSDDFQRVGDCIAMLIAEVREGRVPP